jgi:hypothetical protein
MGQPRRLNRGTARKGVGQPADVAPAARVAEVPAGLRLGQIEKFDPARRELSLRLTDTGVRVRAMVAMPFGPAELEAATKGHMLAVLAFSSPGNGATPEQRPLVIGLVPAPTIGPQPLPAANVIQADVDGRRVEISAGDEVVFKCGKASITLRRNGKVVIRGTYVETHSDGTNRIKGGQVRIN